MSPGGRFGIALVAFAALHAGALGVRTAREGVLRDDPLALTVERLVSGRSETLGRIARGRPLLLVFWTSWCESCVAELEHGGELVERLEGRVEVVFIDVREHRAIVLRQPAMRTLAEHVVLDRTGRISRSFGVEGYPTRVLLGGHGERLWTSVGRRESIDGPWPSEAANE